MGMYVALVARFPACSYKQQTREGISEHDREWM
jgi:hypothetical protein